MNGIMIQDPGIKALLWINTIYMSLFFYFTAKPIHTATIPKDTSESVTSLSSEDSGPPNEFTVSPSHSPPGSIQLSPTQTFSPTKTLQPAPKHGKKNT